MKAVPSFFKRLFQRKPTAPIRKKSGTFRPAVESYPGGWTGGGDGAAAAAPGEEETAGGGGTEDKPAAYMMRADAETMLHRDANWRLIGAWRK